MDSWRSFSSAARKYGGSCTINTLRGAVARAREMKRLPPDLLDRPAPEGARWLALAALQSLVRTQRTLEDRRDPEALHDFRVGLVKLRTDLRGYRSVLGDSVPRSVRRRLAALADAAGECRDADVRLQWLRERRNRKGLADTPGLAWVKRSIRGEQRATERAFRRHLHRDFARVSDRLRRELGTYQVTLHEGERREMPATRALMARTILRMTGELRAGLANATHGADVRALHRARIAAKRLRYALEPLATGGFASVPLAETTGMAVARLRSLQDELGRLNDACVFRRWLRARLKDAPARDDVKADILALQRRLADEAKASYEIVSRPENLHGINLVLRAVRTAARGLARAKSDGGNSKT